MKTFNKFLEEVKPPEPQEEDPSIKSKEKRQMQIKKQVLLKKMQAVRAGAGADIVASHTPDGKLVEGKKKGLDGKACWDGYKLAGTKKKGGKTVDNCVKVKKESLSDWRDDLSSLIEIVAEPEEKAEKKVKEGKVNNKVVINPKISEAIEEMGGEVLEHHQVDCDLSLIHI